MSGVPSIITAYLPAAHQRREPMGVPVAASIRSLPMIDAKTRLDLGCRARRAALAFAVRADQRGRAAVKEGRPYPPDALDDAQAAFDLSAIAQLLQDEAQDAPLHAYLAHRAAGGMVVLKDASSTDEVVVGDAPLAAAAVNDCRSWWTTAARRLAGRA